MSMARLPETTRIARILEMVWRISREPRRWTRAALATEFEISERMVTQDIQLIRHGLGFDLKSSYGEGYYFT
jgi:predicted DNA-binding transcriptional regulator YafY